MIIGNNFKVGDKEYSFEQMPTAEPEVTEKDLEPDWDTEEKRLLAKRELRLKYEALPEVYTDKVSFQEWLDLQNG